MEGAICIIREESTSGPMLCPCLYTSCYVLFLRISEATVFSVLAEGKEGRRGHFAFLFYHDTTIMRRVHVRVQYDAQHVCIFGCGEE